jgi:hypothetical protein
MQEFDDHIILKTKKATFDFSRFEKPKSGATNERASLIQPFVERLNNSRVAGGYKKLGAGFYASKMALIKTEDLYAFYQELDKSKNFASLWWFKCTVPKKKPVDKK